MPWRHGVDISIAAAAIAMHKQRIEEWLRANANAQPEEKEKMQRRLVNIIKDLVTWLDELEKATAEKKA